MMSIERIIGQTITILFALALTANFVEFDLPGHRIFVDNDSSVLASFGIVFLVVVGGLLANSIYFYGKNHCKKYRVAAIGLSILTVVAVFFPRSILLRVWMGPTLSGYKTSASAGVLCKVTLYENGRFLSTTFDGHLSFENIGTYQLRDTLLLQVKGETSPNLHTQYVVKGDTIWSIGGKFDTRMVKQ